MGPFVLTDSSVPIDLRLECHDDRRHHHAGEVTTNKFLIAEQA